MIYKLCLSVLFSLCLLGCSMTNKVPETKTREIANQNFGVTPRLFIQPAPIFDMICQQTPFKIDPKLQSKLRTELTQRIESFQSEWDKVAATIVPESEKLAGRVFSRKEYSVALSLCGWIPMGDPVFLVSALPYLGRPRKSNGFDMPMSMSAFISMTHHELLHSLVDNIINIEFSNSSTLLKRYEKEPFNVLVHLHLMAIQKAVYEKMENSSLLSSTDELYAFIGGDYQRAWSIVKNEGANVFLKELQAYNSRN